MLFTVLPPSLPPSLLPSLPLSLIKESDSSCANLFVHSMGINLFARGHLLGNTVPVSQWVL